MFSKARLHTNVFLCCTRCCGQEIEHLHIYTRECEDVCFDFVDSPQLADIIIVAGPINEKAERKILEMYSAATKNVFIVAAGSCAISGGVYHKSPVGVKKIEDILPVQLFITGCPPKPQDFISAIKAYFQAKNVSKKRRIKDNM